MITDTTRHLIWGQCALFWLLLLLQQLLLPRLLLLHQRMKWALLLMLPLLRPRLDLPAHSHHQRSDRFEWLPLIGWSAQCMLW